MSADVVCMGLGRVPPGEQRCRFLAVGLSDSTVRIISLDPNVSLLVCLYIVFLFAHMMILIQVGNLSEYIMSELVL